jgi:methylthioribose-1-phosphate isomerase
MEKRAAAIETEDRTICSLIGENGSRLFEGKDNLQILTHCNTGALATSGIGTALGVILTLHSHNQVGCVYADETRPVLQGARLTAVELQRAGVPSKLICDNMAALVMRTQPIDAVIVGADRIAANGDTANKIGTYGLAVLAKYHNVPFYIAAPFSTFDFSIPTGNEIVIEERNPDEVRQVGGVYTAPEDMDVFNPAFDVTPHELISGIITEKGVIFHPDEISIKAYERSLQL